METDTQGLTGLVEEFLHAFDGSREGLRLFFAPGRVNLIGEHTDYNNGYVMPFGLQYGTWMAVRPATEPKLRFKSLNFKGNAQACLKKEITRVGGSWVNYPLGVVREFRLLGAELPGLDILYYGDIPNEAGLSSSASIEIVTAYALNVLTGHGLDRIELARLGQRAENDFVGMKCGIMDQFAVSMAEKDHAVFLDCGTLEHELVPFDLGSYTIMIINTNRKRGLAGSKYNERRSECEQAVARLAEGRAIGSLGDLDQNGYAALRHLIADPVIRQRADHVVSENQRVILARQAMAKGDLATLGELMTRSHTSLKEDYDVSCDELDAVVELANSIPGVLGSRMTGAGFGGCAISLVPAGLTAQFELMVGEGYSKRSGLTADFYRAFPSGGAREVMFR